MGMGIGSAWASVCFCSASRKPFFLKTEDKHIYLLPPHPTLGHHRDMGGKDSTHPLPPTTITPPHLMTKKQIRDLQLFAVELVKEGRHDAAREVLALITDHSQRVIEWN